MKNASQILKRRSLVMNKRITSIVLSFVMLFTMLATAVPALAAAPVQLKVTADATSANPGDTIN